MSSTDKLNLNFQNQTRSAIDAAMVNAVVMATLKVCRVMGDVEVLFKRLVAQKDYSPCGDISALVGIAGDTGEGVVAISLSLKAANLLVGRLLRVDPRSVDSYDRKDGVGELVNMIAGSTKIELARLTDASYNLSLPSLIVGNNHEIISRPKDSPYLVMVFELEGQEFIVQMAYKPK